MEKFDVSSFDPNLNYVIEASAGTGKTFNVVEIVNKLVNEYNEDLNKILIVTYTDKAAGELKDRIRRKIKDADVDNAPIYTIHSFCKNTIKEFGISANLPLNLNVIDEALLDSFAERYMRTGKMLEDISSLGCFNQYETIKKTLTEGIKKYYLNLSFNEDDSIISLSSNKDHKEMFELMSIVNQAKCFDDVLDARSDIKDNYDILSLSEDEKSRRFAETIKANYKEHFKFNGKSFQLSKKWPKEESERDAFEFFKNLSVFKDKPSSILVNMHLANFYASWQKEKETNKNQTFDDMIRYVREAILSNDNLKNKLKEKYKRAIIDEFQDTNQKQFDIFSRIFLSDDNHKIIVVGDPKQSIYSFQGADINVYYHAVNTIVAKGGKKCILNKNYRSTSNMVASCNKLFNFYNFDGTNFEDSDFLSKSINNDEDEHMATYEHTDLKAIWLATGEEKQAIDSKTFAKIAIQQIIDCCKKDEYGKTKLRIRPKDEKFVNVSFKDFAVLARTSTEMVDIENALKQAGIPFIRYKDKNLFKGLECAHWIVMLQALNTLDLTGKHRKVFNKLMFTKFFGYSVEEVKSDYFSKDDIKEIEQLNKWKVLVYQYKWEDLFDDILINSKISEHMKTLKEIQSYSKFKQIATYCVEYLSTNKTIDDLIRNLSNLSDGGNFEGDDQNGTLVEKSTNFDCVQIMTIHASKGLQFPVVIAVCGFKGPSNKGKAFTYHDDNNKQKLIFTKEDKLIDEKIKNESIAEWKRLYYVAYTRAQFLMIMPYYQKYGQDFLSNSMSSFVNEHESNIRIIEDTKMSYYDLRKESSKILSTSSNSQDDTNEKINQDKLLKSMIRNNHSKKTYKHSYSSLSHGHEQSFENIELFDEQDVNKEGEELEGLKMFDKNPKVIIPDFDENVLTLTLPSDYPKGAKLGTALHEIFELMDFENYEESLESLIINSFISYGINVKDTWIETSKIMVDNVVNALLPTSDNKTFKLKEISNANRKNEVEFSFNLLNDKLKNFCNGFVDLIFKYDNRYYILDWKSDGLNDTFTSYCNIDSIKQHVDECYSIQRVLYSYCLINYLKQFYRNLTEQEIFDTYFGGIYYIFLRGCNSNTGNGVYLQTWNNYEDLKQAFNEIIKEKVGD